MTSESCTMKRLEITYFRENKMMISIESVTEYFVNQILIFLVCDEMRLHGMYGWYVCVTSIFFLDTNLQKGQSKISINWIYHKILTNL